MEEGVLVARSLWTDRRIAPRLPEWAVTVACHEWSGRSGDTGRGTREGLLCHWREKVLLLERESWKDKWKIKPFLVLGKNLLAWNNARGTILRDVILLTLITECDYRASSISTREKGLHTNLTIMTIDTFISRISIRSSIFKYELQLFLSQLIFTLLLNAFLAFIRLSTWIDIIVEVLLFINWR